MTIVGQCMGANRKDEAVYYIKKLSVIAEVTIIVSCLLVFILTRPVTMLGGMEKTSADMCWHMVMWITIVKPIMWVSAFRSGIWSASSGRCKIFDDKLLRSYVAVQILPVCIANPRIGIRSDGCLDWNVC